MTTTVGLRKKTKRTAEKDAASNGRSHPNGVTKPASLQSQLNVEPPSAILVQLSVDLGTDVIWLSFQSVVDAFEFHHWRAGQTLRSLVFGCYKEERTWERVTGEQEPWEREAFFSARSLTRPWYGTEDEKRERDRIWRDAELLPGRIEPSISARESARKVAEHYHFPGWS
jgi:hypothetical protein